MSSDDRGRTLWDTLCERWKKILLSVIVIAAIGATYYFYQEYPDKTVDFFQEYWPVMLSPVIGYVLGNYVAKTLYRPYRRLLLLMDVETHTVRPIMVPEEIFKNMQQSGNNVVYHTAYGTPTYIVKGVDFSTGEIDYGWIHELNALTVMTREDAYVKWDDTLNEVLEENLQLMHHPQVIGLGYARDSLRNHLDSFSQVLGFKKVDLEKHDPDPEPVQEPVEEEVSDES